MDKYEILKNEAKSGISSPAYRIRALRDIPEHKVRAGDLGGYISSDHNLAHEGGAWVADEAMVIDRARVEGNSLAKDHSSISGNSILDEEAIVGGFTTTKDHAIVRGNARIRGATTIEDEVLIEGDVDIRQALTLSGDDTYNRQDQLPWSFNGADATDPEYLGRLREATEIDPALHRAFAALGVNEPSERNAAIDELWSDPDGRKSLIDIASGIGGTFTPDDYNPRSASELAAEKGIKIALDTFSNDINGYRFLVSLRTDEGYEQHSGERLYAGVVQVILANEQAGAPRTLYQPALYQETDPETPTLTPLSGRTFIGAETYTSRLDADARSKEYLAAAITPEEHRMLMPPKTPTNGKLVAHNTDPLPFIHDTNVERFGSDLRFRELVSATLQNVAPSTSSLAHDLGRMAEPQGFAVLEMRSKPDSEIDLSEIVRRSDLKYHVTPEKAHLMANAIYSSRDDFIARARINIDKRASRIKELNQLFSVTAPSSVSADAEIAERYKELQEIDPLNQPVLIKVLDTPSDVQIDAGPQSRDDLIELLRHQLKDFNWKNSPNVFGMVGVGSHHKNMFEADSLNLKFIVEQEGDDPSDTWSLYVQKPDAKRRSYDWMHPIHHEEGFSSDEEAMAAAEYYRAEMLADEMTPPAPQHEVSAENAQNRVAAVYSERTADGVTSGRILYRAATIDIREVGIFAHLGHERFADLDEAVKNADEMLRTAPQKPQPGSRIQATASTIIP